MWLKQGDRVKVYDDSAKWEVFGEIQHILSGCESCDDPDCGNADEIHYVIGLSPGNDFKVTNYDIKHQGFTVVRYR